MLKKNRLNWSFHAYEGQIKSQGFSLIIGIDEAGRGPLAGPVVASAVTFKNSSEFISDICDSKTLSCQQREQAFHEIWEKAYVGVGIISEAVIDRCNILQATYFAMTNAVRQLISRLPNSNIQREDFHQEVFLLIDGNRFHSDLPFSYKTIVHGDTLVLSIACASIVAKVIRDRILHSYDKIFPEYGFRKHKGYPTKEHKMALRKFGPSLIHRKTFKY